MIYYVLQIKINTELDRFSANYNLTAEMDGWIDGWMEGRAGVRAGGKTDGQTDW